MLEQVELKIKELQQKQAEEYYKKKEADLRSWGLVTKKENGKTTPVIVTDEEYDALIKASNGVGKTGRNAIAVTLNFLAIGILVAGIVIGFVLETLSDDLGFVYMSLAFIAGIILAALLKGVAEAVRLLQQIIDEKPIDIPTELRKNTEAPAPEKIISVPNPAAQPFIVQDQSFVYQQMPQQPVYMYQVPVQQVPVQQPMQPPMQPPVQQPKSYPASRPFEDTTKSRPFGE